VTGREPIVAGANRSPFDRELSKVITRLELPIGLIDLNDLTVLAVSQAALKLLGVPLTAVVGRPVIDLLLSDDRAGSLVAVEALRIGIIDFYRGHPRLGMTEASGRSATTWVRAIQFGDRRLALVEVVDGSRTGQSPLVEHLGREPVQMAVGAMDSGWVVTSVSNNIKSVLGIPAEQIVGQALLGPVERRDVGSFLEADRRTHPESSISVQIQLKDASGTLKPFRCVLTSLAGWTELLFILISEPELPVDRATDRTSQLEQHLWRIAAEVEASGILQQLGNRANPACFPRIEGLSSRQWEVLSHLMRGERVPKIAATLFISQSTVRNHLSAIFERFGVHSQAELLALLGNTDEPPIGKDELPMPSRLQPSR
jgi:DNA-binding CsgD family transcriptional regulator